MSDKRYKITRQLKDQIANGKDKFFDKVQISLSHTTTHMNYFNNKVENAGWYLHFSPVSIQDYGTYQTTTTQPLHERSFKILCNDASRFSQKRFEKLKKALDAHVDKIVEFYDKNDDTNLFLLIKSVFSTIK